MSCTKLAKMSAATYLAVDKAVQCYAHRPDVHRLHVTEMADKSHRSANSTMRLHTRAGFGVVAIVKLNPFPGRMS